MTINPDVTDPGKALERTLAEHGVSALHATTFAGPTVTQYAYSLTAGTPLRKVTALHKDLALSLGLDEVRIVAPIPGTNHVGIEVPSPTRETVTYADFHANEQTLLRHGLYRLPIPVGVSVNNSEIWGDLTELPHLLIAGQTGSGKSVAMASLITALIDEKTPDELRLWLIDPKRVELAAFADAPHVEQLATDVADARDVLRDVVEIMDARYEAFERFGKRNIAEWNDFVGDEVQAYPYQVVVIDELADLMMTSGKDMESMIVRIAQLGRAAGIHLVLATQRPTKDVVTGLIGSNVPSRWAFAVRSTTDSMVALDQPGANALYGKGDSLWLPAGADKPVRVQAVYTDDKTIRTVVDAAIGFRVGPIETTRSPRATDDGDELAETGATLLDDGTVRIDEAGTYELAIETDAHSEPVLTTRRVRDRSELWLEPKLGQDIPADVVDRQVALYAETDWANDVVGEQTLTDGVVLQEIQRLRAENEAQRKLLEDIGAKLAKRSPWRRLRRPALLVAGGFVGLVLFGWAVNLVEWAVR